jgi:ABC-type transport system involved in multi-copper enzyme maturation permease subunit
MRRRLEKEIRPLLFPWAIALGAAIYLGIGFGLYSGASADPESMLLAAYRFSFGASPFILVGALVIATGLSFGVEFHHRTLPFLVSQPLPRTRIWSEKMLALTAIVGSGALMACLAALCGSWIFSGWYPNQGSSFRELPQLLFFSGLLLLCTLCGAAFWSLIARSTLGGLVLSLGSQVGLVCVISIIVNRFFNEDNAVFRTGVVVAGLLYSGVFLWLGRRKFCRMEISGDFASDAGPKLESLAGITLRLSWLRCRPIGRLRNLIRKEVRLNKPAFLIAAVFVFGWVVTVGLRFLVPAIRDNFETTLNTLTVVYVAVLVLISGGVSLGEEKGLGLNASQLTLPISARRLWLVKLLVAVLICFLLAFVLPLLLSWGTAPLAQVGVYQALTGTNPGEAWIPTMLFALVFLATFWASTLLNNTIAATLTGFLTICGLGSCVALASWCTHDARELASEIIYWFVVRLHLPPRFLNLSDGGLIAIVPVTIAGIFLIQSAIRFRHVQSQPGILVRYGLILGIATFLLTSGSMLLSTAATHVRQTPQLELMSAAQRLPPPAEVPTHEHPKAITVEELERVVSFSPVTKDYLKGATIQLEEIPQANTRKRAFRITFRSPQTPGDGYSFTWEAAGSHAAVSKPNVLTNKP